MCIHLGPPVLQVTQISILIYIFSRRATGKKRYQPSLNIRCPCRKAGNTPRTIINATRIKDTSRMWSNTITTSHSHEIRVPTTGACSKTACGRFCISPHVSLYSSFLPFVGFQVEDRTRGDKPFFPSTKPQYCLGISTRFLIIAGLGGVVLCAAYVLWKMTSLVSLHVARVVESVDEGPIHWIPCMVTAKRRR